MLPQEQVFMFQMLHLTTNDHVITGCARVKVASKGKQIEALVLVRDRQNDLAILKVNEKPVCFLN